ncbi:MAG: hypothetical protein ACKOCN_03580, partial [Planctomycetaceae bacterium]
MNTRNFVLLVAAAVTIFAAAAMKSQRTPVVVRPAASGVYDRVQLSVSAASERNQEAVRLCESEINMVLAREFPEIERRFQFVAAGIEGGLQAKGQLALHVVGRVRGPPQLLLRQAIDDRAAGAVGGDLLGGDVRPPLDLRKLAGEN